MGLPVIAARVKHYFFLLLLFQILANTEANYYNKV